MYALKSRRYQGNLIDMRKWLKGKNITTVSLTSLFESWLKLLQQRNDSQNLRSSTQILI